jgi:cytochrome bd ubiquinol oxidase subunit I
MPLELDALLLSRIQFAFTVAFHIVFPGMTIGLAAFLVALEGAWLRTGEAVYFALYRFWVKIFALAFGVGVVTGLVLSYEFGTNWGRFTEKVGNVIGPLMGYEVLTAFFLEAGFLGIMLFGLRRVGPRLHFLATCMVSLGTLISMTWILAANSWMQTPAGYEIGDGGVFPVTSWREVILNPSFPYRLAHMGTAAFLSTAMAVAGVMGWYLLNGRHRPLAERGFSLAMWMVAVAAPLQVVIGDLHGLNTLHHQPMKVAAMEGHWETGRGVPMLLFAIPDQEAAENHLEVGIPRLGSLILTHDWDGEIKGLKEVPPEDRPPVAIVFWSFRVMVGIGFLLATLGIVSLWLRYKRTLYTTPWFHRLAVLASPLGFVAILAGWFVTEVGRQPYTVYGLVRTSESVSPVAAGAVASSLALFVLVYSVLLAAFLLYAWRAIRLGPGGEHELEVALHDERQRAVAAGPPGGPAAASPAPAE